MHIDLTVACCQSTGIGLYDVNSIYFRPARLENNVAYVHYQCSCFIIMCCRLLLVMVKYQKVQVAFVNF